MHFSTLITATAYLLSLAVALPANNEPSEICRCASKVSGDFCGSDLLHVVGSCDSLAIYSCAGTIGLPASVKELCGKSCQSIMVGALGEARCVGFTLPTTNELAARGSEDWITDCTCITGFPAHFCGSQHPYLQGLCDPDWVYACSGEVMSPARPLESCSADSLTCKANPYVNGFDGGFAADTCVPPTASAAEKVTARAEVSTRSLEDSNADCTCISAFPAHFCGSQAPYLQGSCDPQSIYSCKGGTAPARLIESCSAEGLACNAIPFSAGFDGGFSHDTCVS